MGIDLLTTDRYQNNGALTVMAEGVLEEQETQPFVLPDTDNGKSCPYSHLAKNGVVEYKGVQFVCDYQQNRLCLGDVSNMDNCISVTLSGGGTLVVNRDNLGDLSTAIGLFSPEDVKRIMRAIAEDNKVHEMENEIEDDTNSLGDAADKKLDRQDYTEILRNQQQKILKILESGNTDASYQIGSQSYTQKEWDRMLDSYDKAHDAAVKAMKERHAKQAQKTQQKVLQQMQNENK